MSEISHVSQPVIVDKSALNESGAVVLDGRAREIAVYVRFGPGTTGGAVTVETSYDPTFTGTWATLGTIAWTAANRDHVLLVTGSLVVVRVRISTAVTGGTVSAWIAAN